MTVLLAALLLSAGPTAAAAQPEAAPAAPAAAAKPQTEKKICKVDTSDSTSRLRKRVCMTPTEWERAETGKDVTDLKSMGAH
jgi:hypothetical protein